MKTLYVIVDQKGRLCYIAETFEAAKLARQTLEMPEQYPILEWEAGTVWFGKKVG